MQAPVTSITEATCRGPTVSQRHHFWVQTIPEERGQILLLLLLLVED